VYSDVCGADIFRGTPAGRRVDVAVMSTPSMRRDAVMGRSALEPMARATSESCVTQAGSACAGDA
jgi:hypothetical protein